MLVLDVAETLRLHHELAAGASGNGAGSIERLRTHYAGLGIAVPDHVIAEGIRAHGEDRFAHAPAPGDLKTRLAHIYVGRARWGRPVLLILAGALLVVAGYFLAYRPFVAWQAHQARIELAQILPARIDALHDAIYTETKVQSALEAAEPWVRRGHGAAGLGDRDGALAAIAELERIHTMLLAEFTLTIVDREGEPTGVWRFPEAASDATNYYIVVEALAPDGEVLTLPIESAVTGEISHVSTWAVRVPEMTYDAIRADRLDDGVIQRNVLGIKQYGFLEIEYLMPVLGGAITEW